MARNGRAVGHMGGLNVAVPAPGGVMPHARTSP
jgi:hypothetical protein